MRIYRYLFAVVVWLTTSGIGLAAQKSLREEALAEQKSYAHGMISSSFGWVVLGGVSIVAVWEYFTEGRDMKILLQLGVVFIVYFIIAAVFR